jgi:hypothetical protein
VKSGKHYNLKGVVQCWVCKLCGTSFSNDGYFRGKHQLALVQYASVLYQNGCSYEKIVDELKKGWGQTVSRVTIGKWMNMLGVVPRRQSSGDQKNKVVRDLIEVGVVTSIRFASSEIPQKFLVLDNAVMTLEEKV